MTITEKVQNTQSVRLLLNILKIADEATYTHSISVSYITEELLARIPQKWTEAERESIITGALLHDIGKAFVTFKRQNSSQVLDFNRNAMRQTHFNIGYEMVRDCGFDEIIEEIVLLHHERSDGSGYPIFDHGTFPMFTEVNIPDYVALVSYADVFDALITEKPYREAMSMQEALNEICKDIDKGKITYKFKKALVDFVNESIGKKEEDNVYEHV